MAMTCRSNRANLMRASTSSHESEAMEKVELNLSNREKTFGSSKYVVNGAIRVVNLYRLDILHPFCPSHEPPIILSVRN